jgi:hypothetical protein
LIRVLPVYHTLDDALADRNRVASSL